MPHRFRTPLLLALAALPLAGCLRDTASYPVDRATEQAIILVRDQPLFWKDSVTLTVIAEQARQCSEGLDIPDVPRSAGLDLYQPPADVYAEAIYILAVEGRHYAVATQPCGVEPFPGQAPALGRLLGSFKEQDGRFQFTPAQP